MSSITEVDPVLKSVRKAARQYGFFSEGVVGQQILLLGDAFYGYRFTSQEFTAVWSASDQNLKFFDLNGKCLGNIMVYVPVELLLDEQESIQMPRPGVARRVA